MALHIIFLVLVATTPVLRHSTSLIAGTLVIAGTGAAIGTSFHEHTKSVAPSSILQIYFLTAILLDVVRVRTLWLIGTLPPLELHPRLRGSDTFVRICQEDELSRSQSLHRGAKWALGASVVLLVVSNAPTRIFKHPFTNLLADDRLEA
jgi:hypothetical protein